MIDNDYHIDDRAHLRSSERLEHSGGNTTTSSSRMSHSWPMTKNDAMIKEVMESSKTKSPYHKFKGAMFPALVIVMILALVITLFFYGRYVAALDQKLDMLCYDQCRFEVIDGQMYTERISSLVSSARSDILVMASDSSMEGSDDLWFADVTNSVKMKILMGNESALTFNTLIKESNLSELSTTIYGFNHHTVYSQFVIADNSSFFMTNGHPNKSILNKNVPLAGYIVSDCKCLAEDLIKVFTIYYQSATGYPMLNKLKEHWYFTNDGAHTETRPLRLQAKYNESYDSHLGDFHIVTESPLILPGRVEKELDSLLNLLSNSTQYVYISISSYNPGYQNSYWSGVDDLLRKLIYEEKIILRIICPDNFSHKYLSALSTFNSQMVEQRRGNDSKLSLSYVVTDSGFFIGSADWSGDYFLSQRFSISLLGRNMTTINIGSSSNDTSDHIQSRLVEDFQGKWDNAELN